MKITDIADAPERVSPPTKFLSKLLGLFLLLTALCLMTHKQWTQEILIALWHSPALLFVLGMAFLLAGLAIILVHNVWSGGVLPVLVTLIGWISLIRGLVLLLLPPQALLAILAKIHFQQLFYLYFGISLVLGAYLTYGGFRSRAPI